MVQNNPYSIYGKPPMPMMSGMGAGMPGMGMPGMGSPAGMGNGILGGMPQQQSNQGMGGILGGGYQHSSPYLPYGSAGQAPSVAAGGMGAFDPKVAPVRWMDGGPLPPSFGDASFDPKMLIENAPWFQNLFAGGGSVGGGDAGG